MAKSIYLINPRADFPTYYGAEVYAGRGYAPAAFLADLVVPTLAAMLPPDFDVRLCDEHLEPVDFGAQVDYVGITGKVSQWGRMKAIAREAVEDPDLPHVGLIDRKPLSIARDPDPGGVGRGKLPA